ncbi:MAG: hypothetical protein KF819_18335 [Labilithrix sp.]|nr:hypothetical protein [Labilithrix sp.]
MTLAVAAIQEYRKKRQAEEARKKVEAEAERAKAEAARAREAREEADEERAAKRKAEAAAKKAREQAEKSRQEAEERINNESAQFEKKRTEVEERINKEWAESMTRPAKLPASAKRNSIIIVALGGTGKTMLIRHLLKDPNANPQKRTEEYALYHGVRSNGGDRHEYHFYVSDYKGQNIGTLVRAFVLQQKERWSPMAYGYVNTLVVMVDAFPPPDDPTDDAPEKIADPIEDRVAKHIQQWSEPALDAVFGLLTSGSLKQVCFFINKCDLLSNHTDTDRVPGKVQVEKLFEPLKVELRKRARTQDADFAMIFGSAKNGDGIPLLEEALIKYSSADGS